MYIELAKLEDIDYICTVAPKFADHYPQDIPVDIETVVNLVENLIIDNHPVFIAKSDKGDSIGVICGSVNPFIYDSKILTATELFLWVEEGNREGSVAKELLLAFESYATNVGCSVVSMTATTKTPYLDKFYEKNGYVKAESSFTRLI